MKILIVGPSWIGDAVMAQSLYKIISRDSDNKIEVLSPEWSKGILSRMKEVQNCIASPFLHGQLALKRRRALGISLQKSNYDQAIILTNSLKSSLIPYFAKIPKRTSWLGEYRYGLVNDIRKIVNKDSSLMIEQFSLLGPSKELIKKEDIPQPRLNVDCFNLEKLQVTFNIDKKKSSIGLCPGAEFGPAKRWPAKHYSKIAKEYLNKGWNVFILGSQNDSQVAIEIKESLTFVEGLYDLTGKTSLIDAIDILSSCSVVLTNDSGLMHITAALDVPLLALYGPSSPEFTPPLSNKAKVINKTSGYSKIRTGDINGGYHASLFNLEPREVSQELDLLINKYP